MQDSQAAVVGVIGSGTMGRAILGGLLATGLWPASQLVASARRASVAKALADELGIVAGTSNVEVARRADVILLCVKPQVVKEVLADEALRDALDGKVLVSIAAGVRTEQLARLVPGARIVRAMPNTPSVIRQGMTVVVPGPGADDATLGLVSRIFEAVGRVRVLEEKHLDVVTALSGSGPAFVCVIIEALADGGVMMGLPRDVAVELAAQTVQGAGRLVLETGRHPAALKDQVTTPAGCTIAGLLTMEDRGIRSTLARTIEEAAKVACGLGKD
jgi:pyrroline-5-carboxylate reductase